MVTVDLITTGTDSRPVEMEEDSVIRNFRITVADGKTYDTKVTAEIAKAHAESEFEKYRIVQDRLFESDFDRRSQDQAPRRGRGEEHAAQRQRSSDPRDVSWTGVTT